ncbi:hypothetical protein [Meridianimarinicoccus aquatilis]|uniref:Uncharacterized protein n=1 Tax=Meridianimarinicoccus aquatilis TaxID=2552766 RepID=A0A4R6AS14_9RHOB|nr:hypothetical protein [Fluviibacterium aquatile]TDL84926.1 hypothetical protein E2L05_16715 [Fluviibacterium aquatile]TDL87014.1 hypothetical protein E2L05_11980 [Fluviibacterium aquatile]
MRGPRIVQSAPPFLDHLKAVIIFVFLPIWKGNAQSIGVPASGFAKPAAAMQCHASVRIDKTAMGADPCVEASVCDNTSFSLS